MRPKSIILFERFYLVSLVLVIINGALSWNNNIQIFGANPATASYGPEYLVLISISTLVVSLVFWYLIARRASQAAKWIFVSFFGIGMAMLPFTTSQSSQLDLAILVVIYFLQICAIGLLFRPDSSAWFKGQITDLGDIFD